MSKQGLEVHEKALRKTGVLSSAELACCPGVPSAQRLRQGPVAVIECSEEIPCNPCEGNCPRGAIRVGSTVTSQPCLDPEGCVGCALCVSRCPGLAIFVVDLSSDDGDHVSIPYEFLPLPESGELVEGVDREGRAVCTARTLTVDARERNDRTAVVTLLTPKGLGMDVRFFRRVGGGKNSGRQ